MKSRRIVVRVVVLLFVMIGLLWLMGGRTYSWNRSFETTAAPGRVFACLTEPESISQWMSGIDSIEPLTDFGPAIGARNKITVERRDGDLVMEQEILAYEQDQLLRVSIDSPSVLITNIYSLEPFGEQTRVRQQTQVSYRGFARLFAPFLGTDFQQQLERDQTSLKQLVEKQPAPALDETS